MKKYLLSLLICIGLAGHSVSAITITTEAPGTLAEKIGNPSAVLVLTVQGPIDASDMVFIEQELPGLMNLDLSGATIEAYSGKALKGITTYPANHIPMGIFTNSQLTSVALPRTVGLSVGDAAFAGSKLVSVDVSSPSIEIGAGAFSSCPNLESATVNASSLPAHAFAGCASLSEVTLSGISTIPVSAFADCPSLTTINGAQSVTAIDESAFAGCSALSTFDFGTALTSIGKNAFTGTGLSTANLGDCKKLTTIGAWAFAECPNLTTVNLPASVKNFGEGAFFHCPSLSDITYGSGLTEIPAYAFAGSENFDINQALREGVISVGDYAFLGNTSTSVVKVPSTLEYLGNGAMENMSGLTNVNVYEVKTVPELGTEVWRGVDQKNVGLEVQSEMSEDFAAAEQWQDFKFMISTGVESIISPEVGAESILEGRFVGTDLQLRSRGSEIAKVDVYLPTGALVISETPQAMEATISTSHISGKIFIIECALADGSRASLKLLRK